MNTSLQTHLILLKPNLILQNWLSLFQIHNQIILTILVTLITLITLPIFQDYAVKNKNINQ